MRLLSVKICSVTDLIFVLTELQLSSSDNNREQILEEFPQVIIVFEVLQQYQI